MDPGPDDRHDDDDRVLSPEELDISRSEHVASLGDGRYVVSPNDPVGDVPAPADDVPTPADDATENPPAQAEGSTTDANTPQSTSQPRDTPQSTSQGRDASPSASEPQENETRAGAGKRVSEDAARERLARRLRETDARYAFDATAKFDDAIDTRRTVSNDVVTTFETLALWYAQQVDDTTPVEEVLGILLAESNVPVRYPTASLRQLAESTGLSPDDSIADLIAAVENDDGFRL